MDYLVAFWNLSLVPTAVAIAAVFGFVKLLRENKKLQFEVARLERESTEATSRVVRPTASEVERFSRRLNYRKLGMLVVIAGAVGVASAVLTSRRVTSQADARIAAANAERDRAQQLAAELARKVNYPPIVVATQTESRIRIIEATNCIPEGLCLLATQIVGRICNGQTKCEWDARTLNEERHSTLKALGKPTTLTILYDCGDGRWKRESGIDGSTLQLGCTPADRLPFVPGIGIPGMLPSPPFPLPVPAPVVPTPPRPPF